MAQACGPRARMMDVANSGSICTIISGSMATCPGRSKPATAERRTGRKTGRKSSRGGGLNFSFEVDVSHKKKGAIAMALPNVGEQAPAFSMRNQQGADTTLEQYKGHYVVLWWYPKADTPG